MEVYRKTLEVSPKTLRNTLEDHLYSTKDPSLFVAKERETGHGRDRIRRRDLIALARKLCQPSCFSLPTASSFGYHLLKRLHVLGVVAAVFVVFIRDQKKSRLGGTCKTPN